jgi:hypothetical protein
MPPVIEQFAKGNGPLIDGLPIEMVMLIDSM